MTKWKNIVIIIYNPYACHTIVNLTKNFEFIIN